MTNQTFFDPKLANQFGKDYVKILVTLLKNNTVPSRPGLRSYPKVATGRLIRSINYKLQPTAEGIQIQLLSEDYLKYVDKGRRAGAQYPPIGPLLRWARVKGLPEGAAYGAQKNIHKYGIKPTNVIDKTIRIINSSREANRRYEENMVNNIVKMLENNYKAVQIKFDKGT
jgi:hypothetical protein